MLAHSNGVHVYIGLDRKGNIVEFVRVQDGKEITKQFHDCSAEQEEETEPVENAKFELRRKVTKRIAADAGGNGPAAPQRDASAVGGGSPTEHGTAENGGGPAGDPSGDPCCVRLQSGQIFCFC